MAEQDNGEVSFDDSTVDDIVNTITERSIREGVDTIAKPSVDELKQAAKNFLTQSESLQTSIQNIEAILKEQQKTRHSMGKKEYSVLQKYIDNRNKIRTFLHGEDLSKLWALVAEFQMQLNSFIGQKVEMVYVFVDNNNEPVLYEMENTNILKGDYSRSNRVIARYRATQTNFENDLKRIVLDDKDYNMTGVANATATYQEIMTRYNNHKRQRRVMWLNPSPPLKWHVAKIYQVGDINEAYANIILSHQESLFAVMSVLDTNIEVFMVLFYTNVDNASGLLQGDIEYQNIEYGIKSAGASMMQLKEVQNIAEIIVNTENVTEDLVRQEKERLANQGSTRNAIYGSSRKSGQNAVKQSLDELKDELRRVLGPDVTIT